MGPVVMVNKFVQAAAQVAQDGSVTMSLKQKVNEGEGAGWDAWA